MKEADIRQHYEESLSRVKVWCDEYHAHGTQCLDGDPRDIAFVDLYKRYHALRERVRNLKTEV